MKLLVLLMALAVCSYASPIASELVESKKVELPSVSAVLVTELLEVTFHMDAELAKQIGHLFRDVPLSIAKELVAFVGKVFADVTGSHVADLSIYFDQAMHIFQQVWEHINVKEVVELVASNVLPPNVVAMLEKLMAIWGRGPVVSALLGAAVTAATNWAVTTVLGLVGKRNIIDDLLSNVWTAVVNTALQGVLGFLGGIGKRGLFDNLLTNVWEAIVDTTFTHINNILLSVVESVGKRGVFLNNLLDAALQAVIGTLVGAIGKRGVFLNNLLDAALQAVIGTLVDGLLTIGKRGVFLNNLLDAALQAVVGTLVTTLQNFGKRGVFFDNLLNAALQAVVGTLVDGLLSIGKRGIVNDLIGNVWTAVVDTATDAFYQVTNALLSNVFATVTGWIGKREESKGLLLSLGATWAVNQLINVVTGKRGLWNNIWTAVVDTATDAFYQVTNAFLSNVFATVTGLVGKRQRPVY